MSWIVILIIYVTFNYFFACHVYRKNLPFYNQEYATINGEKVNLFEKYSAFRSTDQISFIRIFIGLNLFFWIKLTLCVLNAIAVIIFIRYIINNNY